MKFLTITTLLTALVAASPIVENVERRNAPDPKQIKIKSVQYAGSGCPPGTASSSIVNGGTTVTLGFSEYGAQTGGLSQPKDARRNCNVLLDLEYPVGWSYSVATTILQGDATVPKHCKATLGALYSWSGRRDVATCETRFEDFDGTYVKETAVSAEVWAQCNSKGKSVAPFNVNTYAKIDCNKKATLFVDRQDTSFDLKFYLKWRRC